MPSVTIDLAEEEANVLLGFLQTQRPRLPEGDRCAIRGSIALHPLRGVHHDHTDRRQTAE